MPSEASSRGFSGLLNHAATDYGPQCRQQTRRAAHDRASGFLFFYRQHLHVPVRQSHRRHGKGGRHRRTLEAVFLRSILAESNYTPFVGNPAKTAYMWRDIERRAARQGTPWNGAAAYPVDADGLANHVAFPASCEGWCEEFVAEIYRRWFTLHEVPGDPVMLAAALDELGQYATTVIARARSDDVRNGMVAATDEARASGVFGSPSFVVDGKLFWGDDRLEDALAWATGTFPGLRDTPTR